MVNVHIISELLTDLFDKYFDSIFNLVNTIFD